jgi:hypothetical protein
MTELKLESTLTIGAHHLNNRRSHQYNPDGREDGIPSDHDFDELAALFPGALAAFHASGQTDTQDFCHTHAELFSLNDCSDKELHLAHPCGQQL